MDVAAQLGAQPAAPTQIAQSISSSTAVPPPQQTILPTLIPTASAQLLQQHQINLNSAQNQQSSGGTPPQQITQLPHGAQSSVADSIVQTNQVQFAQLTAGGGGKVVTQQQQIHHQQQRQEMVSIPKDVLMKLVEQRLEAERTHLQTPSKCQCHCQCGRYPNDMFIVDKVVERM
jgi:hypothetical protein